MKWIAGGTKFPLTFGYLIEDERRTTDTTYTLVTVPEEGFRYVLLVMSTGLLGTKTRYPCTVWELDDGDMPMRLDFAAWDLSRLEAHLIATFERRNVHETGSV